MPWRVPLNTDRPTEPLGEEGVRAIHDGAMRILEEIGHRVPQRGAAWRSSARRAACHGAFRSTAPNVRMGRDLGDGDGGAKVEGPLRIRRSPRATPRDRDHHRRMAYRVRQRLLAAELLGPGDRQGPGTREQCRDLLKLTQYFNCIHFAGGYPVEPVDMHASVRHLDVLFDKLTLTDKVMHAYSLGPSGSRT
jgi:trimethylamine--corrinoid protein Co-methyltransferase